MSPIANQFRNAPAPANENAMRSELMNLLLSRGYVHQLTAGWALDDLALAEQVTGYVGFDLTAPSLHVGNLVSLMLLRRLQQAGHRPIILLGGGTSMIGDPSGKDESRQVLTAKKIEDNKASIQLALNQFIETENALVVDNHEWLSSLGYISFLREIGAHFSVNRMLSFDSVKLRLDREQPLSFLEFNYMILQAYDYLELNKRFGCRLQMGGSDQWGNIVNGVELVRRIEGVEVFGLTTPLVSTTTGQKMGKTVHGAVWLNANMLSPYEYWQYWRNTDDADVGRFLRLFTDISLDEINRLEALAGSEMNSAKKVLADAACALAHGPVATREAAETARLVFEEDTTGNGLPTYVAPKSNVSIIEALVELSLVTTKGEARRLILQGGARVDGSQVWDPEAVISIPEAGRRISAGRKRHGLLSYRPV